MLPSAHVTGSYSLVHDSWQVHALTEGVAMRQVRLQRRLSDRDSLTLMADRDFSFTTFAHAPPTLINTTHATRATPRTRVVHFLIVFIIVRFLSWRVEL